MKNKKENKKENKNENKIENKVKDAIAKCSLTIGEITEHSREQASVIEEADKNSGIRSVWEEELRDKQAIIINKIEEGFSEYKYLVLKGDKAGYRKFLDEIYALNGEEDSYADFYYGNLTEQQREGFLKVLSKENQNYVKCNDWTKSLYFKLNPELLHFLLEITLEELLFSTFYFTRYPCTIWGNYNMRFPVFFNDKKIKNRYQVLAEQSGLILE